MGVGGGGGDEVVAMAMQLPHNSMTHALAPPHIVAGDTICRRRMRDDGEG